METETESKQNTIRADGVPKCLKKDFT